MWNTKPRQWLNGALGWPDVSEACGYVGNRGAESSVVMNVGAIEPELKALMLASQAGDAKAHRQLLERLSGHLRAYFKRRLVQDDQSAEDLVQETLLAIHSHRQTYNPERPLTPWVYAIARYRLIDYLRANKAADRVPIEEASEVVANDDTTDAESAFDLERLMARLPAKTRDVIQSVKVDGLSVKETAARTGMSESAVKVSTHRGLRALASLMSREAAS